MTNLRFVMTGGPGAGKTTVLRALGEVEAYVRSFPYNTLVLLMPPWEAMYRTDSERDQTFAEAVQVYESVRTWYARWGYEPVEVPRMAIDHRVTFILQTIEDALTKVRAN